MNFLRLLRFSGNDPSDIEDFRDQQIGELSSFRETPGYRIILDLLEGELRSVFSAWLGAPDAATAEGLRQRALGLRAGIAAIEAAAGAGELEEEAERMERIHAAFRADDGILDAEASENLGY